MSTQSELIKNLISLRNFRGDGGSDKLSEYCLDLRMDVDLATELRFQQIHEQREDIFKQIEEYKNERLREIGKNMN